MNPCPYGYFDDPFHQCTCSSSVVSRYQTCISGPFLDQVVIFIEVPHIDYQKLTDDRLGESSANAQSRVEAARDRQQQHFHGIKIHSNNEMIPTLVRKFYTVGESAENSLKATM